MVAVVRLSVERETNGKIMARELIAPAKKGNVAPPYAMLIIKKEKSVAVSESGERAAQDYRPLLCAGIACLVGCVAFVLLRQRRFVLVDWFIRA